MRVGIDARKIADFGIGTYIRGLLGELSGRNDLKMVAFAPADAKLPSGVERIDVDAPHYSLAELVVLGRAADRARLDLFHAPHYVVPITSVPVIVTIHDLIHLHQPRRNPIAPLYARVMIGRALRKAARVLTITEAVRRDIASEFAFDPSRIDVAHPGIDQAFSPGGSVASGRYFLYAGNDLPHKNVATLVEAFTQVRRSDAALSLVLVGASFERFREVRGVVAPGFVSIEELAALHRGALAVVMPSAEEGFGLPAAEAMASGTAVITSDAAALVEITGDAALHAATASVTALASAMTALAGDATLRSELVERGLARAARFTWARCAEITVDSYRRALG